MNRFYSTESSWDENEGAAVDLMVYSVKKYNLDISIMPWANNINTSTLVWMGQQFKLGSLSPDFASSFGV